MIFGIEHDVHDIDTLSESMNGTHDELMSILIENAQDLFNIRMEILNETVSIEEKLIDGNIVLNEATVLMESTFSDKMEKFKQLMITLRDKFIAWFNSFMNSMKVLFTNYEKFLKENKDKIDELKSNGYTTTMRLYKSPRGANAVTHLLRSNLEISDQLVSLIDNVFEGQEGASDKILHAIENSEVLTVEISEYYDTLNKITRCKEEPKEIKVPVDILVAELGDLKRYLESTKKLKEANIKLSNQTIMKIASRAKQDLKLASSGNNMVAIATTMTAISRIMKINLSCLSYMSNISKQSAIEYHRVLKAGINK